MRAIRLLVFELAHHLRTFRRFPIAAMFTVAFPLMFLLLFNTLMGEQQVVALGGIPFAQFFTPAIGVFAVVTAGFTNLAISTAIDRDEGILKRTRATPLPPWIFVAGKAGASTIIGLASVALMVAVGSILFDVEVLWPRMGTALLVLIFGSVVFAVLGLALAGAAPNGQSAPAIANAIILPLAFVSGVFFPIETGWIEQVASIFPLRPFLELFSAQWNPTVPGDLDLGKLGVLLAWTLIGAAVAAKTFSWEPRPGGRRRSG